MVEGAAPRGIPWLWTQSELETCSRGRRPARGAKGNRTLTARSADNPLPTAVLAMRFLARLNFSRARNGDSAGSIPSERASLIAMIDGWRTRCGPSKAIS